VPRMLLRFAMALALTLLAACSDDAASGDAATDGAADTGVDTGPPRDSGMRCDPSCDRTEACCPGETGLVMCIPITSDPDNCGGCGIVCADGRGSRCESSHCVCGRVINGCQGTQDSFCCPPRDDGGTEYCADLNTDSRDCGGCNDRCSPETSSGCQGGECFCGDEAGPCAGTAEDTCCPSATDVFTCTDVTADVFHCGACGRSCDLDETCEFGNCVRGASCGAACGEGQICCEGSCCDRVSCESGGCT